jgi:hypothetical protein
MSVNEAQQALDDFWEGVQTTVDHLSDKDRQRLLELEKQLSEAKRAEAANN